VRARVCVSTSCLFAITFKEGKKRSKEKKDTVFTKEEEEEEEGKIGGKNRRISCLK